MTAPDQESLTINQPVAEERKPPLKLVLVITGILVALVLTAVIFSTMGRGDDPLPIAMSTPITPTPSPTPLPTLTPEPVVVPRADPQWIDIEQIGVHTVVELYTVAEAQAVSDPLSGAACYANGRIVCVNPLSDSNVVWLKAGEGRIPFGDQPGSDATGTVYLMGHGSSVVEAVFNQLHLLSVGATVDVTTSNGVVRYIVQEVVVLDKGDWSSSSYANEQVPGRLVLGTCNTAEGADAGGDWVTQNVLVIAQAQ